MPCYTVRLISVEFKAQNEAVLKKAASILKWSYVKNGNVAQVGWVKVFLDTQLAEAESQKDINALKRAYSQAAVSQAAQAKGWTVESWSTTATGKVANVTKY